MEGLFASGRLLNFCPPKFEIYYPARSVLLSPLSFGRANDGLPVTSQTLLFRLPIELVEEVVAYLDTSDLRTLALVDRDCRQLARSRLFTSVVLDFSDKKRALLDQLSRHEARSRRANGNVTKCPLIGACIRRVTVAALPRGEGSTHRRLPLGGGYGYTSVGESWGAHNSASKYSGIYLLRIVEALHFSLPNLHEFIWDADVEIPRYMLTAISSSPIRHLRLRRIQLSLDREYHLPPPEQQKWALRSLDLGTAYTRWQDQDARLSNLCLTILEATAPTLEKLTLRCERGTQLSFGDSVIRFPRLRILTLDTSCMPDDTVLDTFFPTGTDSYALCNLSVNARVSGGSESLLQPRRIRGLQSLRLYTLKYVTPQDSKATDIALISANPQLKSLTLLESTPERLTTALLPLITSEFKFLTTLIVDFTSRSTDSPYGLLTAIGRLTPLTSLWIVASERHDWTADVPLTIAALSPLRNLVRLGLSRQYSPTGLPPALEPEGRYKERMRYIVELYVRAFRELRWVYFGLLVHRVVGNAFAYAEGEQRHYSPAGLWESPDW